MLRDAFGSFMKPDYIPNTLAAKGNAMGYVTKNAKAFLQDEVAANLDAVRHSRFVDWAAYQRAVGWLDGVERALEAIEQAEREAGRDKEDFD
jgi:hypothetical protein